ncbi:MAG: TlpA family protein disulfide reductase [Planctomycetes bacterium]|nr:TlpA family protein disulfide reductase [Planctomycetota bacterium]
MAPHLVRWHEQFASKGLTILDIDNGDNDTFEALKEHVAEKKLPFAVAHDAGAKTCSAYGIRGYPSAFLVGVDGKVIWQGFPLPEVKEIEKLIAAEIAKIPAAAPKEGGGDGKNDGKKDGKNDGKKEEGK